MSLMLMIAVAVQQVEPVRVVDPVALPAEMREKLGDEMRRTWRQQLLRLEVARRRTRDRDERRALAEQIEEMVSGEVMPAVSSGSLQALQVPLQRVLTVPGTSTGTHSTYAEPISVVDGSTLLCTLYSRGRRSQGRDYWLSGVDTSDVVTDQASVPISAWFLDVGTKEYTTVIGATRQVRHLQAIEPATFELVWKSTWKSISGDVATIHADVRRDAAKSAR